MSFKFKAMMFGELILEYIHYGMLVAFNAPMGDLWRSERRINSLKLVLKI